MFVFAILGALAKKASPNLQSPVQVLRGKQPAVFCRRIYKGDIMKRLALASAALATFLAGCATTVTAENVYSFSDLQLCRIQANPGSREIEETSLVDTELGRRETDCPAVFDEERRRLEEERRRREEERRIAEEERRIYTEIKRLGADLGIVDFGMRALLSMRLEKNFPTWFAELRPIYGPYEADMGRFIKLDKGDFIGRDAAQEEKASGGALRRVTLAIDTDRTDVMAHEPIWARRTSSDDFDSAVVVPHGYGARRFDENNTDYPKPAVQSDGDWQVVGWVTSGGYGHSVGASLAQGYLPKALVSDSNSVFQVEILGKRFDAELVREPLFDPAREKMLS